MAGNAADRALLAHLQAEIRAGKKTVTLPAALVADATELGLTEARQLARLCGVRLVVEG